MDSTEESIPQEEVSRHETCSKSHEELESGAGEEPQSEESKSEYLLLFVYAGEPTIDSEDVVKIVNLLNDEVAPEASKGNAKLTMLVDCRGGDIYSAYKIVNLLRSRFDFITAVIPFSAKSAATLIVLDADKVVMGAQSELGPLDKPIEHPTLGGRGISALDCSQALEYLGGWMIATGFEVGLRIRQEVELGRKEAIATGLEFAFQCGEPLLQQIDPLIVNQSVRWLEIGRRYAEEFIARRLTREQEKSNEEEQQETKEEIERKPKNVGFRIVYGYPDHSFAISAVEARDGLGLNVVDSREYEDWNTLWELFLLLRRTGRTVIELWPKSRLHRFGEMLDKRRRAQEETKND